MLVTMDTKDTSSIDQYARDFAKRLRDARGDMPQADLLRLLEEQGTSLRQARLSHYETGRNYPDPPILALLATVLGVSADWLLGLTGEPLPVADLEEKLAAATGNHKINKIMDRLPKEKQRQLIDFGEYLASVDGFFVAKTRNKIHCKTY